MPLTNAGAEPDHQPSQRWYKRYPVEGSLVLETSDGRYEGQPINLSLSGILFKAVQLPPVDTTGTMTLGIYGFKEGIVSKVRVMRSDGIHAAAIFLFPDVTLAKCIEWLSQQVGVRPFVSFFSAQ